MNRIIGLTGGIGCGKSSALYIFGTLGAEIISADHIAHVIMRQQNVIDQITAFFGPEILDEFGRVDRNKLGKLVFEDQEALYRLNSITHPFVRNQLERDIDLFRKEERGKILIVETPLLYECGLEYLFDEIIVVVSSDFIQLKRLKLRNNLTTEEAQKRINVQMPLGIKMQRADRILHNNGSRNILHNDVCEMYEQISLEFIKENECYASHLSW